MKITERQRRTVLAALYSAAEYELSYMDAHRDRYSTEWRPARGLARAYRKAERARNRYLRLRKRLTRQR